jgi:hypothetical protein
MRRHSSHDPAGHTRDAALRKLTILNRCLIAGSVTLTGVLAELAAHAFPGRTVPTADTRHGTRRAGDGATSPRRTADPLRAPAQAPRAANTQASTTPSAEGSSSPAATTPSGESPASAEATQANESAATTQPEHEATPAQETAPAHETAPTPEPAQESAPVVSGGS